jgi:hypothetical protein
MKGLLRATAVAFLMTALVASAASFSAIPSARNYTTQSTILGEGPSPSPEWPPDPKPAPNAPNCR